MTQHAKSLMQAQAVEYAKKLGLIKVHIREKDVVSIFSYFLSRT